MSAADPDTLGLLPLGTVNIHLPGDTGPTRKVFQRVGRGLGNLGRTVNGRDLQMRAHVIPADPKTAAQLHRRAVFADAVSAWRALTDAERAALNQRAKRYHLSGWNLFISTYLREHP